MHDPAVRVSPRDVRPTCGHCRSEILDDAWECPGRATPHHQGCARENGGCAVLGCRVVLDARRTRVGARGVAPSSSDLVPIAVLGATAIALVTSVLVLLVRA